MTNASQLLPSLLFLAVGATGLLFLADPDPVGAAAASALGPAATPLPGRAPAAGGPVELAVPDPGPRRPLAAATPGPPTAAPAQTFDAAQIAQLRRRIEEKKEARRREVQLAREQEEAAWIVERAGQIAAELELAAGSATRLADVLIQVRDRQSAAWETIRGCGASLSCRQELRESMQSIRSWRAAELTRVFGEATARRIEAKADGEDEPEAE